MKYDYLIVGAGLFGCVFAQQMRQAGKKCLVIDKRNHIGGNIYTQKRMDINVHQYGAHIFHTSDEEVWSYVNQYARFNNYVNSPIAVWKDELYNLPFNMNTFSRMWGIRTPQQAQEIIGKQSRQAVTEILQKRHEVAGNYAEITEEEITGFEAENLEEQGLCLAGRDIFEKLVKGYTEKQWGRSCAELPAFIIRRLPFRFIYDNNYFNDPYQGIPIGGYTLLAEKMLEGTEVRLDTDYYRFLQMQDGAPVRPFASANGDTFGKIVFTGMIDEFYGYRLGMLEYRSLRFETQELPDTDNYQGNAVVNYTEREVPYTRIIEHRHFEYGRGHGTIITREYPATWKKGDEPYYPMNDEKNNSLFAQYQELAKRDKDVIFGGRLGQYKYYNMDQVIRAALDICAQQ
ncbi:MAG: UDP-galactopyranose mutase [Butyrivibrio sp.]|jgi:UDP-galactopyranose mutase|nr:UDP-galactopyranose mutase [Butyrivibrio sp.]